MTRQELSKAKKFQILERDGFACRYCGARAPEVRLHVDHVTPVSRGGTNDDDNLVAACADCNLGKGIKELRKAFTMTIGDDALLCYLDSLAAELSCDMGEVVERAIRVAGEDLFDQYIAEAKELSRKRQENGVH